MEPDVGGIILKPLKFDISIHGLRVEPDVAPKYCAAMCPISIHGLRVEPDAASRNPPARGNISIHGLRVEPDFTHFYSPFKNQYFNPRAPCGARPLAVMLSPRNAAHFNPRAPCGARQMSLSETASSSVFQSTGSVWSPTLHRLKTAIAEGISIHGLRVEPDFISSFQ